MGMRCSLTATLGLEFPILQAPIGSMGGAELAAAVCEAGGMGSLALTWCEPAQAAALVRKVRSLSSRSFLVNFVLSFEPLSLNAALDAGAPVVSFSWGLPGELVRQVHASGAQVAVQVGTAVAARRAIEQGCDLLICQGVEAGGHVQSSTPLAALLPAVLDVAGDVPVVAAGGLADAGDVACVLASGAQGAMLGTRFVATRESRAHPEYRAALVAARESCLTGCFEGGWPYAAHRVLRNRTLEQWEDEGCPPLGRRPGEGDIIARSAGGAAVHRYEDTPPAGDMSGSILECCLYAGSGVARIDSILSAREVIESLAGACSAARNE